MLRVETCPTVREAASALRGRSRYLGGGTLVMRAVNDGDQSFDHVVRCTDPVLKDIRPEGARVRIGAGCTMSDILAAPDLGFLGAVARRVGGPAVRNMATLGGNLFAPHPYGDLAAALLSLDGVAHLADGSEQPLDRLLASRDQGTSLVVAVSIARPAGADFRFLKVSRVKPKGVSVMSIAAWLPRPGGRVSAARIAYAAMGRAPQRAAAVERALEGARLDASVVERAVSAATEGFSPPDDALASGWYRREVAPVHLRRVLLDEGHSR